MVFGALIALFGLLSSIKATTERLTQACDAQKARRLRSKWQRGSTGRRVSGVRRLAR